MRPRTISLAVAGWLLVLALAGASAASAKTVSDSDGPVQSSFSYTESADRTEFKDFQLDISRNGALLLRTTLPKYQGFFPGGFLNQPTLNVEDLDGDGEPEVLLDLFSGGAHCCVTALVFRYQAASNSYKSLANDFGDVGFKLRNLDGKGPREFLSRDPVFSGAFSSYAESRFPIQVLRLRKGKFADVTSRFGKLVRADLRRHRAVYPRYRKQKLNARGVFAAVAADQYRLGDRKGAAATLRKAAKVYGPKFARSLRRFLTRYGYRR